MQQHTGQHLLSAVFAERFGLATVSVHFGAAGATLDLDAESLSAERLREAEAMANTIVSENRAVTVAFEDAATATGLRKPSDRGGVLRIVSIDGLDRSACGGTHVRSTGEIGPILLRRTERVRRTTRVEFVCGLRAVRRARADYEALVAMATQLSASIDEVPALVGAQQEQLREAVAERNRLDGEVQAGRARALYEASTPNADGVRVHVERTPMAPDTLRALAQAFVSNPRALFVSVAGEPPTLLVAASEDSGLDAGAELRRALAAVGGKGGGSARLAQGRLPSADTIDVALVAISR
jgi:alanyl-tRNA synthetase